jgi:hypothetical protein
MKKKIRALRYIPFYPLIILTAQLIFNKGCSFSKLPLIIIVYLRYLILEPFRLGEIIIYERKIRKFPLDKIIFVIGHWRSGTTHLQHLLSLDENHTTSSVYQFLFADNFILTEKWLKPPLNFLCQLFKIPYSFQRMPLDLNLPGELESAMCGFCSPHSYAWGHIFPKNCMYWMNKYIFHPKKNDLKDWLDDYEFLIKKFSYASVRKIMIVKSPGDTARILALSKRFPNSKFIHISRNKKEVITSTSYFWEVIQKEISFQKINPVEVNQIIKSTYEILMKNYDNQKQITNNQLIEVQFEKLIENPIDEINRIYSLFNLGSPDTQKILQLLEKNKQLREQKNL